MNTTGQFSSAAATPAHRDADVVGMLRRRRSLILFGLVLGLVLGTLYYFQAPVIYESEVQILVMKKDATLPAGGAKRATDFEEGVGQELLATHMQLLQSPRIIQQGLEKRGLLALPTILQELDDDETPVTYVIDNLEVDRGGEGLAQTAYVLNAAFSHTSPEDSAAVLNAVIESYQDFLGEKFQDVGQEALALIAKANDELRKELNGQWQAYQSYREEAPLLFKGEDSLNIHQERLREFELALSKLRVRRTESEARLAVIQETREQWAEQPVSDLEQLALLDDSDISRLSLLVDVERGNANTEAFQAAQPARTEAVRNEYARLLELLTQERTRLTNLGPDHPDVREVRDNIQVVRSFLDEEGLKRGAVEEKAPLKPGDVLDGYQRLLRNDLVEIARQEGELELLAERARQEARSVIKFELQDEAMRGEIERLERQYDTVMDRLGEVNLAKDYGGYITEVIAPVKPGEQVWPKLAISLGLGGALGLMLGLGLGYGVDLADTTFRTPEEVEQVLDLPVLTHMPDLSKSEAEVRAETGDAAAIAPILVVHHRPRSAEAEVFRGLRTLALFELQKSQQKIIQVTSPSQGDGKSVLTGNLALAIAQSGRRTLLIDGDMRRPRVDKLFTLDETPGLSAVLRERASLREAVVATPVEHLFALPCGEIPQNPAELLTLPSFAAMLKAAREEFDYILVDSPPLLAVSDPSVIAASVDRVLLMISVKRNGRPAARRARAVLDASGKPAMGVVVNGIRDHGRFGYGSYGNYAYGRGSAYGEQYGYESEGYFSDQA